MGVRPTILEPIFHLVHKSTQRRHGQQLVQRCEYCRTALGPSTHYCVNSFGCVDNRVGSGSVVWSTSGKISGQPTRSGHHRSNYCDLSYAAICGWYIAYFNLCNPAAMVPSRGLYFSCYWSLPVAVVCVSARTRIERRRYLRCRPAVASRVGRGLPGKLYRWSPFAGLLSDPSFLGTWLTQRGWSNSGASWVEIPCCSWWISSHRD